MASLPQAWFQLVEARSLLRSCAENCPALERGEIKYVRSVDVWQTYTTADARVARLQEICKSHLAPVLESGAPRHVLMAAGILVTVDMAIDAVLDQPRAGNGGDPNYIASLPRIDLDMGRAVA